jgi:hypothetical protein
MRQMLSDRTAIRSEERIMTEQDNDKEPNPAAIRQQYDQVCANYRAIDDFRGKLLALWPILGGAAGGVALLASDTSKGRYLWAIALFGFVVTVGIMVYERTQTIRCNLLMQMARKLEKCQHLGVGTGQFTSFPLGFKLVGNPSLGKPELECQRAETAERWTWKYPIRVGFAGVIVYSSVLAGWLGLMIWGIHLASCRGRC